MKSSHEFVKRLGQLVLVFSMFLVACTVQEVPAYTQAITITLTPLTAETNGDMQGNSTPTPGLTPSHTPTSTPAENLLANDNINGLFLLEYIFGGEIYLQELSTGRIRALDSELRIISEDGFLGWTRNGCGFYVRMENFDIVEVDLKGNILRKVFSIENFNVSQDTSTKLINPVSRWVRLSPSEERILFTIGSGERHEYEGYGSFFDQVNLFVQPVNGDLEPTQLSQRGGAWYYEWSPDSNSIVFTDRDPRGINQIYLTSIDGLDQKQVTDFSDQSGIIHSLSLAPNGKFLSFYYSITEDQTTKWIVNLEDDQIEQVDLPGELFWDKDSVLIASSPNNISMVNPTTGIEIESYQIPEITGIFSPFGEEGKLACLGFCVGRGKDDYGFYILDLMSQQIENTSNFTRIIDVAGWEYSPPAFKDESTCKYP